MKISKALLIAAMTNFLSLQQAFSMPVENVQVTVCDINGSTSAPLLDKMSDSMSIVAQQLLVGRDTENIVSLQQEYKDLFAEIGDRALTGYTVERTQFDIGVNTDIVFYIAPWNSTINDVEIDLQFSGIEPQTAKFMEQRIPALKDDLRRTITGASADAKDWAGGILRKIVRSEIEKALPEFKAAVDLVQEGDTTVVQVIIYPVGQLIGDIRYEMRSETVPNILLNRLKLKYIDECEKLRGLPVSYLQRHKQEYEEYLSGQLAAESEIRQYNLKPRIMIEPGADTEIEILLSSDEYKIWFEGYGDIGRGEDNLSGKAHIGKFISERDEVFGEAGVILDHVQWNFGVGYTRYWGKSSWSYTRRIPYGDNAYKLEYTLSNKWRLRAEHFSGDNRNEYAVRYRIHEYLSAEYVYGGDEFYLRMIGNL